MAGLCSNGKDIKVLAGLLVLNPYFCKDTRSFIEEHIILQWEFG